MKTKWRYLLILPALILVLVFLSFLSNLFMPQASPSVTHLSEEDKARLAEALQLRALRGDAVWPGFAQADIPIIVYNEAYAFLVNYEGAPPVGWRVPRSDKQEGTEWEEVADDTFLGRPYYRQALQEGVTPQAFTVRMDSRWAASLLTYDWARIKLAQEMREDTPRWLSPILPYPLVTRFLIGDSQKYISLLSHESFHAFAGGQAGERLVEAETVGVRQEGNYPWTDEALVAAWEEELELLQTALQAETREEAAELAGQFLEQRNQRRADADLARQLIRYEQEREWVEGLAKFVEMEIWRQAAANEGYQPHAATEALSDFDGYDGFKTAWEREVDQITRMATDEGDGRFYYSGMAQAILLERLAPGWKASMLTDGASLETQLEIALEGRPVTLFYSNNQLDPAAECDRVFPVTRTVSADGNLVLMALEQLVAGPTAAEQQAGYHAWFSPDTAGVVRSVHFVEESAYVNFDDLRSLIPNASTSCGSAAFFAQVEATVRSAEPGVRNVYYALEGDPALFYDWMQIGCEPGAPRCDASVYDS